MGNTVFLLAGLLAVIGCGNSGSGPMPQTGGKPSAGGGGSGNLAGGGSAGAGGSATAGDTAGGSSTVGGALTFGDSMAEACLEYSVAVCRRTAVCAGRSDEDCITWGESCPDQTASPGATRTVQGLKACAAEYAALPCEQIEAGSFPPCVTPGERARGESCVFASQCSSLACKYTDADCGVCAIEVGMGESCAAADVECAPNLYCGPDSTCLPFSGSPMPSPGPNQPCAMPNSLACVEDYWCPPGPSPVCTPVPTLGQSCDSPVLCASGSYCEGEAGSRFCVAAPGQGEPCALPFDSPIEEPYVCGKDLLCSYASSPQGTCEPVPTAGQPCNIPPGNPTYGRCAASNCNFGFDPPMCRNPGEPGDPCAVRQDCELDLVCGCPEGEPQCAQTVCISYKLGGAPCGADMTATCHPAFDCTAGTCQPADLRGDFTAACGN